MEEPEQDEGGGDDSEGSEVAVEVGDVAELNVAGRDNITQITNYHGVDEQYVEDRLKVLEERLAILEGSDVKNPTPEESKAADEAMAEAEEIDQMGVNFPFEILDGLARVFIITGNMEKALQQLTESLKFFRMTGDAVREIRCLNDLGHVAQNLGDIDEAEGYYQDCAALSRREGDVTYEAKCLGNLANIEYNRGNSDKAERMYRQALETFRDQDDREGEAASLGNIGNLMRQRGDYEGAEELYQEALALGRENEDRVSEAQAMYALGDLLISRQRNDEAESLIREALQISREEENPAWESYSLVSLGRIAGLRDDFEEEERYYREALEVGRESGIVKAQAQALDFLGVLCSVLDRVEEAEGHYREALGLLKNSHPIERAGLHNALGNAIGLRDDLEEAEGHYLEALRLYRSVSDQAGEADMLNSLGALHLSTRPPSIGTAGRFFRQSLAIYLEIDDSDGISMVRSNLKGITRLWVVSFSLLFVGGAVFLAGLTVVDGNKLVRGLVSVCGLFVAFVGFSAFRLRKQ